MSGIVLWVADDLVFSFDPLPAPLESAIKEFCGHFLQPNGANTTGAIHIRRGSPPHLSTSVRRRLVCETPVTVEIAGTTTLLKTPGILAWFDPDEQCCGIEVQETRTMWIEAFILRLLPSFLFELAQWRGWLGFHAAALGLEAKAILLPGSSGSGKSTIFLNAAEAGMELLSDDLVWLHEEGPEFRVVSFPRGAPAAHAPGPTVDDLPLCAVVCPTIVADAGNRLVQASFLEILNVLTSQSAMLSDPWRQGAHFKSLVRAARSAPGYRLLAGQAVEDVPGLLRALV